MNHRYSTALSHVFLAAAGIYCINTFKAGYLPYISYGIIIANSLLGIWRWGNPVHGRKVERIYYYTKLMQTFFVLPCIVAQLWLNRNPRHTFAYIHPMLSIVPLILYNYKKTKQEFVDIILGLNMVSCCWVSFVVANWFGVACAFSYAINHFVMREDNGITEMPTIDLYNYALCFFSLFAARALQGVM